jgi:hypothetical protein
VGELAHGLRLSGGPENEKRLHLADRYVQLNDFARQHWSLLDDEGADCRPDIAAESVGKFGHSTPLELPGRLNHSKYFRLGQVLVAGGGTAG